MSEQITGIPLPGDNDAAPSTPIFLQGDDWFAVDVKPYQLDFTKAYEAPQYTLSWNGIPFAPRGGIHAITGQAGNGKTMTLAQFMAAILCGEYGELRYELSDVIPNPKVLYIDTEMEEANTIAVKNRVMTLCERPINEDSDDFVVIMLREVPETTDDKGKKTSSSVNRWRMTLKAIYEYKPTAVFIDGLLDVVADFNDNKECQEIIYKCMQVASHYNISVWCIVHQNPGGEKLVGHLGSFLERKVTDVFQTKKDKNDKTGDVTFTVSQKKARGRDVADWQFRVLPVDSWGRPEQILAAEIQRKGEKSEGDDPEKIKQWINEAANRYEWPMSRGDIKKTVFCEIGGQLNHGKQDTDLPIAINLGYLEQSTLKKNGAYMLQPKLPF
jgi:KaiC/GvpD/RAD55 family RecA-like ATPase